jgi:hypothetical protein
MSKLFQRSGLRLVTLGGAKACTNGSVGNRDEIDLVTQFAG